MYKQELPSPARKRQRMSSPTYDEQVNLSQDDIEAFDKLEQTLSQSRSPPAVSPLNKARSPRNKKLTAKERRQRAIEVALSDSATTDKENLREGPSANGERASSSSPSKQVPFSSQPRFDLESDNPFNVSDTNTEKPIPSIYPSFQRASAQRAPSATAYHDPSSSSESQPRSPSPELPPEQDYSSWFEPVPENALPTATNLFAPASALPLFASASALLNANMSALPEPSPQELTQSQAPIIPVIGFMKASKKGFLAPSAIALQEAEKKMQVWQEGDSTPDPAAPIASQPQSQAQSLSQALYQSTTPQRPVMVASDHSFSSPVVVPDTPTPAGSSEYGGFGRAVMGAPSNTSFSAPSITPGLNAGSLKQKPKAFKSPLLKSKPSNSNTNANYASSPLNPNRSHGFGFASASSQHPLAGTPINATTPVRPTEGSGLGGAAGFVTPMRSLHATAPKTTVVRSTPAKFNTPFKPGMRPGEAGRVALDTEVAKKERDSVFNSPTKVTSPTEARPNLNKGKGKERWKAFDLSIPPNRQTLSSSGLVPQCYDSEELEAMGINAEELSQITPVMAPYYSFHTASPESLSSQVPPTLLGATAALEQLLERGCTLATKPWVDNHWALILWKLSAMVCLDPERESDGREKRWCWDEVMRQMFYRYERELNSGSRPPLRKICTQDTPASSPMVLCISNITWSDGGVDDDGNLIKPHPELEVTDGWYRLRAQVDECLARAARKGALKVGRKIAVAGAKLSSERKDPQEVLEAYNSTRLVLSGNSSHLAPWHAKLGFLPRTPVATMHHFSGDGGHISAMAVVVIKAYPIAFIETIEDDDGNKRKEGPYNVNEEATINEKWKARREIEASKLQAEIEKRMNVFDGYADRLERRAGPRFHPGEDDEAPNHIDNLYDDLEEPSRAAKIISSISSSEAGWLAKYVREKSARDREAAGEEIEQELQKTCPPRQVRSFGVILVQDAYSCKKPSHRKAQLTVWDALNLRYKFQPGQRFMVTNVRAWQANAWMNRYDVDSEIMITTIGNTGWFPLK